MWIARKEGLTELREKPLICQLVFSGRNEGGGDGLSKCRTSHSYIHEPPEALQEQDWEDNVTQGVKGICFSHKKRIVQCIHHYLGSFWIREL